MTAAVRRRPLRFKYRGRGGVAFVDDDYDGGGADDAALLPGGGAASGSGGALGVLARGAPYGGYVAAVKTADSDATHTLSVL